MKNFRGRPAEDDDRIRCDACGSPNDPDSRPHGGEFSHINAYNDSGDIYDGNGAQGCWFCGCPAWMSGGSLGDMKRIFGRK